jgi:hypothetical protein
MQRFAGIMLVTAVLVATLTGCALRDPRDDYAYSRASDGLWEGAGYDLIDWNFPTSQNQPPVEGPKRIRLERTAIGVTWATRNPLPLTDNLPAQNLQAPAASNDEAAASPPPGSAPIAPGAAGGPAASDRGHGVLR